MASLAFFVLIFLAVRVLIALVNLLSVSYLRDEVPGERAKVSVLIPARNEEKTLPLLLGDLSESDYEHLEIIVCDDHSTDRTPEILQEFSSRMPNLYSFKGDTLPEGWLGKNFACHQLANRASGDYLLFLDADVRVSRAMVRKAVSYIQSGRYSLVSVFPTQLMVTLGELVTVPVMNWILLGLLPLPLVRTSRFSSLSAANGQFMLFNAVDYHSNKWHEQVRSDTTEDIVISRLIKKSGLKMSTLTGNSDVKCRMYTGAGEAISGFSKNVHQFFGGSRLVMVLFSLIVLLGWLPVGIAFGWYGLRIYLIMVIAGRVFTGMTSRQGTLALFMHPVQMFAFAAMAFMNIYRKTKGEIEWKGRKITI